jgi:hypothetical protein
MQRRTAYVRNLRQQLENADEPALILHIVCLLYLAHFYPDNRIEGSGRFVPFFIKFLKAKLQGLALNDDAGEGHSNVYELMYAYQKAVMASMKGKDMSKFINVYTDTLKGLGYSVSL